MARFDDLAATLGHAFARPELLTQALTHPSVSQGRNPRKATPYERLEFLGDRVLGLVVADLLFHRFPLEPEGALARRHTSLVRRETLARVAAEIGLDECIQLAKGDETGRGNPNLLADACEAVIGALYADAGFDVAAGFVRRCWGPLIDETTAPPKDAKTALQEWAQGRGRKLPTYTTIGMEGPAHDPMFQVEVTVEGLTPVVGSGPSKRVAEQAAAKAMLEMTKK